MTLKSEGRRDTRIKLHVIIRGNTRDDIGKVGQLRGADIKAKSSCAVMVLGIGTFAGRSMRFIRSMILARIPAPDQIGIMAIVMSIPMAFEAFTEVRVKQSKIQNKQGAYSRYLNVAWWMQVARALCLFGIAFL